MLIRTLLSWVNSSPWILRFIKAFLAKKNPIPHPHAKRFPDNTTSHGLTSGMKRIPISIIEPKTIPHKNRKGFSTVYFIMMDVAKINETKADDTLAQKWDTATPFCPIVGTNHEVNRTPIKPHSTPPRILPI